MLVLSLINLYQEVSYGFNRLYFSLGALIKEYLEASVVFGHINRSIQDKVARIGEKINRNLKYILLDAFFESLKRML